MYYTSLGTATVCDHIEWCRIHARIWGENMNCGHQEKCEVDGKLVGHANTGIMHNVKTWTAENPISQKQLQWYHTNCTRNTGRSEKPDWRGFVTSAVANHPNVENRGVRTDSGGSHTISLVAGNNKVGSDSLSPSIHGFLGCNLSNSLRLAHAMVRKHQARMRSLFSSGYLGLGQFKDCILIPFWGKLL